eukprot:TRINITY_DN3802_c0_g1_i1.p1 TRINITY_DN3802_c0_g1~~TRINITY_DN3802_c0_g1_i1.p1  ORF type:complete len:133 (-),score=4.52 TRINITY_DN3802_c0_g1_i1:147-545(-)
MELPQPLERERETLSIAHGILPCIKCQSYALQMGAPSSHLWKVVRDRRMEEVACSGLFIYCLQVMMHLDSFGAQRNSSSVDFVNVRKMCCCVVSTWFFASKERGRRFFGGGNRVSNRPHIVFDKKSEREQET